MQYTLNGFKQFVEEMDPTPEKSRDAGQGDMANSSTEKQDYFASLEDEQGIQWKDLVRAISAEPWVSSHFKIGSGSNQTLQKLTAWEIVPGSMSENGASIRLKPQRTTRSYLAGNRLDKSKNINSEQYHLNRDELIKFLTTGWTPAVQQASGGMPGMPGGMV